MKPTNATVMCAGAVLALSLTLLPPLAAQGMPPEAREAIHTLLNRHEAITRKVEMTARGYVAVTESDDPEVVAALRRHVKQMEERLESGLRVRRWDPAFAEYVAHYRDIDHTFKATARGVRMTVKGRTPEAVQVAQNHARVVSEFAELGWAGHDREHPAVLRKEQGQASPGSGAGGRGGRGRGPGGAAQGCCENGPRGGKCCGAPAPSAK